MNRRECELRQALYDERQRKMGHINGLLRDASEKLKWALKAVDEPVNNVLAVALILSFGMTGCGGDNPAPAAPSTPTPPPPITPPPTTPPPTTTISHAGEWYGDAARFDRGLNNDPTLRGIRFSVEVPRDPRQGEVMSLTWKSSGNEPGYDKVVTDVGTWDCDPLGASASAVGWGECVWKGESTDKYHEDRSGDRSRTRSEFWLTLIWGSPTFGAPGQYYGTFLYQVYIDGAYAYSYYAGHDDGNRLRKR